MLSDNPRGRQALDICAAFTGLAALLVSLRLFTRMHVIKLLGVEDYLIAVAMISSIGLTVTVGFQAANGMGKHVWETTHDNVVHSLKAFFASLHLYNLSLSLTKTAILLQYRRVFTTRRFRIICDANLAFVAAFGIASLLTAVLLCTPISAIWTMDPTAKCVNKNALYFTHASINVADDFIIFIMPLPVIWRLQLPRRQKIALIGIFAVGGFVCVVSITRLVSLIRISSSTDTTYTQPPAAIWSSLETNVGIICSCLPLLRPLFTRYLPGVFLSAARGTTHRPYSTIGGSRRCNEDSIARNEFVLRPQTKYQSQDSDEEHIGEIQICTDIRVHVEEDGGKVAKSWNAHASSDVWRAESKAKAHIEHHERI